MATNDPEKDREDISPRRGEGTYSSTDTLKSYNGGDDYEKNREKLRNSNANSKGVTQPVTGIDVRQAEEDFAELSKQLSSISQRSRRVPENLTKEEGKIDVESASNEHWDLESALHGSRAEEAQSGIKSKRIGKAINPFPSLYPVWITTEVACLKATHL